MRHFFSMVLVVILLASITPLAVADRAMMYNDVRANPSDNVDNPFDLSTANYSAPFAFKEYSATMAIGYESNVTFSLNSTYINFSSSASVPVYIKAYYWNGSSWISAYSKTINVDKTATDYGPYTITGLSSGKPFYIRLSKTQYSGYKCIGTIVVEGN